MTYYLLSKVVFLAVTFNNRHIILARIAKYLLYYGSILNIVSKPVIKTIEKLPVFLYLGFDFFFLNVLNIAYSYSLGVGDIT